MRTLVAAGLLGTLCHTVSGQGTNGVPNPSKLSRTVGLDIISNTVNADKSVNLTFKWSEKGKPMERTVVVNDNTIVVYNGQIKKFSDLKPQDLHAKAVATVGADGVTTILLRFGKTPPPKDQLTPAQAALLASLAPPPTAASDAALEKRVTGIVDSLALGDTNKEAKVHAVISTDLRAVRDAHNAGLPLDPSAHQNLTNGLAAELTPSQVDSVKDMLTANKLPTAFKVYHQIITNLTKADDDYIMGQLLRAREESLDVKNPDDMAPLFKKHKTEIEHYLNAHGYDWAASYKAYVDAQKAQPRAVE